MAKQINILSDEAIAQVGVVVEDFFAARRSLTSDQRRGRGLLAKSPDTLVGQITRVIAGTSGQPSYDARGTRVPTITVTNQTPFYRDTDSSVFINPAEVGDECELFKDSAGVWRLGAAHEFMATADCQAVAGSRSNMAFQLITTTPTDPVPITADWIDVDASGGAVTLTLPEEEVGKRISIRKVDSSANAVTINNTINGEASMDIVFQYDRPDLSYNGTEWSFG